MEAQSLRIASYSILDKQMKSGTSLCFLNGVSIPRGSACLNWLGEQAPYVSSWILAVA